jgi:hypothetical protein
MMAFFYASSFIEIFTSALDVNVIETEDKLSKDLESILMFSDEIASSIFW